jgi:mannose-1-phosphate guanylyltransferase
MGLRAVVLVGGKGTRLQPLTFTRPKPILPVGGVPMLALKMAHLAAHGVTEAVLSLGYKPDPFFEAFPDNSIHGVTLHYAIESEPLDTAGALKFAATYAGFLNGSNDDPIIGVNGDVLTDLDLTAQMAFHVQNNAEATIALTQVEDPSAFGVVPTDDDGRVLAFVEKPPRDEAPTDWINAGAYVLQPAFFRRVPEGKVSLERAIFPLLVADKTLFAVHSPAYWIDAGIPSTYLQANLDAAHRVPTSSIIHPTAKIAATAVIRNSVIGAGVVVGESSIVDQSVIDEGATIGTSATITDSMVGQRASVGDGAVLRELTVVGDEAIVAANEVLDSAKVEKT